MNFLPHITETLWLAAEATSGGMGAGPGEAPQPPGGAMSMLMMMVPFILVFYLIVWRPEKKRRQQMEQLKNSIKKKDKVWTIGGIQGTVVDIDDQVLTLMVDPNRDVKIKIRRAAVESIEQSHEEKSAS